MKTKPTPSQEALKKLFFYDRSSGLLFYKERPLEAFAHNTGAWVRFNKEFAGQPATATSPAGYRKVRFHHAGGKVQYLLAHRVIWKIVYGFDAYPLIDHIDRDKLNNRLGNLRIATPSENVRNSDARLKRKSVDDVGVYLTRNGKFKAQLRVSGKCVHFGTFESREHAVHAVNSARKAGA